MERLKAALNAEKPQLNAAFINSIAEEGTKEDAIKFLRELWYEKCELEKGARLKDVPCTCGGSEDGWHSKHCDKRSKE